MGKRNMTLFDEFWQAYPKKTGKITAEKKFKKLDAEIQKQCVSHVIERVKADLKWSEGYVPNPETFINQGRWMDEYEVKESEKPKPDPSKGPEICPQCHASVISAHHQQNCMGTSHPPTRQRTNPPCPETDTGRALVGAPPSSRPRRSIDQNKKFHAMCRDIAVHLKANGAKVSEAMVKELCKAEFGPPVTISIGSKQRTVPKPSSKWNEKEMSETIDTMIAWAATDLDLILENSDDG